MTEQEAARGMASRRGRRWAFWRWRGRHVWESARWPLITVLFVTSMVLGWIGFDQNMQALGQSGSFWDKLYLSLQLVVLQSGAVAPPVPWQLEIARLLAPAVAAYATLSAMAALLGEQFSELRARMRSDHIVVCGLGPFGALLVRALCAAGYDVVAMESDPRNAAIGECREAGAIVLIGEAVDRTVLRTTGVERARFLFAVTGDDGANTEIAFDARKLVEGRKGSPLTCFVHISNGELGGVLRQLGIARLSSGPFRLETFSAAERGAAALLREHPAFDDEGETPFGPPHLLVVGLGEMGSNLVVRAARRWRSIPKIDGRRFKVTVVDNEADEHVAVLNERFPRLASACDVAARRMELDSAEFERADFLFDAKGVCDITGVYVCIGDDAIALGGALHLRHRLGDRNVPIVVRTTQEGGVSTVMGHQSGTDRLGGIEVFGLFDLVCKPEVLLRGQNEVLARAIHETYLRRQRQEGQTRITNPSMVDWEELSESLREANRHQAADISHKLQTIGCDVEPLTDWDAPLPVFSPEEVEVLARMEHDRFWHERKAAGWKLAPERNAPRKESPFLVPYEELPEEMKRYDIDTVLGMPAFLAEIDFAVVRVRQE